MGGGGGDGGGGGGVEGKGADTSEPNYAMAVQSV